MKTILTLTAAIIGGILLPAAVFAGSTEAVTGCATLPVDGANYTVRADVTCALSDDQPDGFGLTSTALAALTDLLTPDEEEPAAE